MTSVWSVEWSRSYRSDTHDHVPTCDDAVEFRNDHLEVTSVPARSRSTYNKHNMGSGISAFKRV